MFEVEVEQSTIDRIKDNEQKEIEKKEMEEYLPKVTNLLSKLYKKGVKLTVISSLIIWNYKIVGEILLPGDRVIPYYTPKEMFERLIEASKMMTILRKTKQI